MESVDELSCASDVSWKQLHQVASIEESKSRSFEDFNQFYAINSSHRSTFQENTSMPSNYQQEEQQKTPSKRSASTSVMSFDERDPLSSKRACISQKNERDICSSFSMDSLDVGFSKTFSFKLKEDDNQDFNANEVGWDLQGQGSFEGGFSITGSSVDRPDSILDTALTFGEEEEQLFTLEELSKSSQPSDTLMMDSKANFNGLLTDEKMVPLPYNYAYATHTSSSYARSQGNPSGASFQYPFNRFLPMAFMPPLPGMARTAPHPVYMQPSHASPVSSDSKLGAENSDLSSWSKADDEKLSEILKKHKTKNWDDIAAEFGNGKSPKECNDRWVRYLKPGVRKGQWTDQEDRIVIEAVEQSLEQPFTKWSDLAQKLPGRVGKQIRDRWVNHLNPNINHLPFAKEDDMLLYKGHEEHGKKWVEISASYFNSTRSENQVKNRWYSASFKKFCDSEFGPGTYASFDKKAKVKEEENE